MSRNRKADSRQKKKIEKYHPSRVRRKIVLGVGLLWVLMLAASIGAIDLIAHSRTRTVQAIEAVFGVPDEVAYDFVDRGGVKAALHGKLEQFLETEDGIGYDVEEKLIGEYGWTRQQILDRYPTTAWKAPVQKAMDTFGL